MTSIPLSAKAAKLMKLCDAAGFACLDDLLSASITRQRVPCDLHDGGLRLHDGDGARPNGGYCEACGGNTVVSALVLAGLI